VAVASARLSHSATLGKVLSQRALLDETPNSRREARRKRRQLLAQPAAAVAGLI
jgi:hypothetical protein